MSCVRTFRPLCVALVLVASSVSRVYGDEDPRGASQFFRAATRAYESGDNKAAAIAFEHAYRLAPRGPAIYNAALAWQLAGEEARAADAFALASKSSDLDAAKVANARSELTRLERLVGRVDVDGPSGSTVSIAHAVKLPLPAHVHVSPGKHVLSAFHPSGSTFSKVVDVGTGAVVNIVVPAAEPAPPPSSVRAANESGSALRPLGWLLAGAGVLGAGVAIYCGVRTLDARDEYAGTKYTSQSDYDRAFAFRTATNVAWLTSALLAIGGTAALVVDRTRKAAPPPSSSRSRAPSPHGGALRAAGSLSF